MCVTRVTGISNGMKRVARLRGPTWKRAVCARPFSIQSPIDVDQTTIIPGPTRGAASVLGGKRGSSSIGMNRAADEAKRRSAVQCADVGGVRQSGEGGSGPQGGAKTIIQYDYDYNTIQR
jgi:hypothetical protein